MSTRGRDLRTVGRQLFGLPNLTGTDFADIVAVHVSNEGSATTAGWTSGIRLEFTVSWDVIGKALDNEGGEALERLRTIAGGGSETVTVKVPRELLRQHELLEKGEGPRCERSWRSEGVDQERTWRHSTRRSHADTNVCPQRRRRAATSPDSALGEGQRTSTGDVPDAVELR